MSTNAPNQIPENFKGIHLATSYSPPPMPKYGNVRGKKALFMRFNVGEATDPDDQNKAYEMSTSASQEPMITSKTTCKTFVLYWHELIRMAVEAGIDNP